MSMECSTSASPLSAKLVSETRTDLALRASFLTFVVAGGMVAGLLLSWRLWVSPRAYPLSPVAGWWPVLAPAVETALVGTLMAAVALGALVRRGRWLLWVGVLAALVLAAGDQSRWQPWFYQYVVMLGLLGCCPSGEGEGAERRRRGVLDACRVVVAGTYVYSGLQKFNVSFATGTFPWLVEPLVPDEARRLVESGALLVPVLEAAIGVGLLVPQLRGAAALGAVGMHGLILACLGPWGHDWNTVVWPWNVAMAACVLVLFWRTPEVTARSILWPGRSAVRWAALLLFGAAPALCFFGRWDPYLSAALYSGNTLHAELVVSAEACGRLPAEARKYAREDFEGGFVIDCSEWAMGELNVPAYPAERVFRDVARCVGECAGEPGGVRLLLRLPPHWLTGERLDVLDGVPVPPSLDMVTR